jgi:hypothetical protein
MRLFQAIVLGAMGLAGCSASNIVTATGAPAPELIAAAPRRPLTDQESRFVQDAIKSSLKDPTSAQFEMAPIVALKHGNGGFVYCGKVNSRNSYGAYTGFNWFSTTVFPDDKGKFDSIRVNGIEDQSTYGSVGSVCGANGY